MSAQRFRLSRCQRNSTLDFNHFLAESEIFDCSPPTPGYKNTGLGTLQHGGNQAVCESHAEYQPAVNRSRHLLWSSKAAAQDDRCCEHSH